MALIEIYTRGFPLAGGERYRQKQKPPLAGWFLFGWFVTLLGMNKTYVATVFILILVLGVGIWWERDRAGVPRVLDSESVGTTSTSTSPATLDISTNTPPQTTQPASTPKPTTLTNPFSLASGEVIGSWSYKGAYTGNPELERKAQAEIQRLDGMFGTKDNSNYMLYVSIANQYDLLGDGAKAYEYLLRALKEDSNETGLAWYNLGALLVRLDAPQSARKAYAGAVAAQPTVDQYQTRYLEFLTLNFPTEEKAIEDAYTKAKAILGEQSTLLQIRARWLEAVGRTVDAIATWKKVLAISPSEASAIGTEIQRLESGL